MKVAMNYESSIYPEIIEDFITDFELGVACLCWVFFGNSLNKKIAV